MATAADHHDSDRVDERTKPPFLRRVRIRGYKSIAFCDVELQPLTVLVGRNGSGKSNFLDALGFLRDALGTTALEAVRLHGGTEWHRCRTADSHVIEIGIETALPGSGTDCLADYAIRLLLKEEGLVEVERESLRIRETGKDLVVGFEADHGLPKWFGLGQIRHGDSGPERGDDESRGALSETYLGMFLCRVITARPGCCSESSATNRSSTSPRG